MKDNEENRTLVFLTKYGWVFLVAMISIGALIYFDVGIDETECECFDCELSFLHSEIESESYNQISCCYEAYYDRMLDTCEYRVQTTKMFLNNTIEVEPQGYSWSLE